MTMMSQIKVVKHKIKYRHENTYFIFNIDKIRGEIQRKSLTLAGADGATAA